MKRRLKGQAGSPADAPLAQRSSLRRHVPLETRSPLAGTVRVLRGFGAFKRETKRLGRSLGSHGEAKTASGSPVREEQLAVHEGPHLPRQYEAQQRRGGVEAKILTELLLSAL